MNSKFVTFLILTLPIIVIMCNEGSNPVPRNIDHLVYTVSDLSAGMDRIESLLGVRPVLGGRHPDYGTYNALLSFGDSTYLEIIAPDPDLAVPERGRLLQESFTGDPKLTTWVLRTESIEDLASKAEIPELNLGMAQSGSREKPDGTRLSWTLTDPYALPFDGAVPFLIHWGDTPHPAGAVPRAGTLIGFRIEHPEPEALGGTLELLGVRVAVEKAVKIKLVATIKTDKGVVDLY